ncbi:MULTISPECIES: glycosyltransferase family 2 protein [unclassified Shewanella]|uniref:glycosyltransferase family 2 protein n=1 Tax=unclassified Shewanella TaxID=196818 RepID=UPI001BC1A6BD|nr:MULTISPECIES: glycosyltransferase family 2 protein [unclassified Shewanella]GIU14887.1 glycosyl transferase family 2 [Shewanella sp. MBTL60-112-B1]GIU37591.1 glycosyl transferase family 2 [Shewanella sp. MBTL60-112-B2]
MFLIVTTYNWPEALRKVLDSIALQTVPPFEVIIADDGSSASTKQLLEAYQSKLKCPLIHCWQEDRGFRVARNRNHGIVTSKGDYIVFIDGDMILAPKFIEDHIAVAEPGYFVQGRRAYLNEQVSSMLLTTEKMPHIFMKGVKHREQAMRLAFLPKSITESKRSSLARAMTANCAFWRDDVYRVNGFNNDFEGWGPEDIEFFQRLFNTGLKCKKLNFKSNCYHIYHPSSSTASLAHNHKLLDDTIKQQLVECENGLRQL